MKTISYEFSKDFINGKGAFFLPNEKIVLVNGNHQLVAENYCQTQLTIDELKLYKKYCEQIKNRFNFMDESLESDFLCRILRWDKITINGLNTIYTTSPNAYQKWWNYSLNNWNIAIDKPLIYDEETGLFHKNNQDDWQRCRDLDEITHNDLRLIKERHLSVKERQSYLK